MLKDKKKILILTGAGISAASGIPTFRGDGGFWRKEPVEINPNDPTEKIDPQIIEEVNKSVSLPKTSIISTEK